ncbi:MAG TPA: hypothetical protein PLS50_00340 [Candidatus Dojkabacteria bacterium]|nr:hypothetical protein [Candidatus Dojkabacteria bacterium]
MSKIWDSLKKRVTNSDLIRHSHHVAAIVYKNRIITFGFARYKTHPLAKKFQTNVERIFLHAEVDAIIKAINKIGIETLKECDLYVLRTSKGGHIGNSKPCDGCMKTIETFGIRNVYWSRQNGQCE